MCSDLAAQLGSRLAERCAPKRSRRLLPRGIILCSKLAPVAEMTRDQLTAERRSKVWPGFSFLDGRGWGYGLSFLDDGRYTWEGGLGTMWLDVQQRRWRRLTRAAFTVEHTEAFDAVPASS